MKIVDQLLEKEVKVKKLTLPEHKPVPEEVLHFKKEYLDKFGINNTTREYIVEKEIEIERKETQSKEEFAKNEVIKNIISAFGMYKVVPYSVMDEIAKEHNLYMSGIRGYKNAIPVENLEELNVFTDYLKGVDPLILKRLQTPSNSTFIFNTNTSSYVSNIGINNMFFIMAPKSHFKMSKGYGIIGREIGNIGSRPKFNYEFKVNQPEPKDPIIFLPIKVFNSIFCVIITAWDKVADDLRIRQLI